MTVNNILIRTPTMSDIVRKVVYNGQTAYARYIGRLTATFDYSGSTGKIKVDTLNECYPITGRVIYTNGVVYDLHWGSRSHEITIPYIAGMKVQIRDANMHYIDSSATGALIGRITWEFNEMILVNTHKINFI